MGKIWLQLANGNRIHLPIVGADLNTPDTAIAVNTAAVLIRNRCLDGTIQVVTPQFGTVTFDFGAQGRTGTCNQCGQCCSHPVASCTEPGTCGYVLSSKGDYHICKYLTVLSGANRGIGKSGGTECSVRDTLLSVSKGCSTFPDKKSDITNCPACGYTFTG